MWKPLSGMLAEMIYDHLDSSRFLPEEQKGCQKGSRGTKDQLFIDKMVSRNCKRSTTNLTMAWIDYRKAYDMVPHSWIIETLRLEGIAPNIQRLIQESMPNWKTKLTSKRCTLGEIIIRQSLFQGDSLSPLLFIIFLIHLSIVLRRSKGQYRLGNESQTLDRLDVHG